MASLNKLAQAVDEYYTTREQRLKMQKEVDAVAKREAELKKFLIDNISKSEATGVCGQLMRATIKVKEEPSVNDWPAFYEFVRKHKAFDLLQKRLLGSAIKERWEDGVEVPGVEKVAVVDVSLTRL